MFKCLFDVTIGTGCGIFRFTEGQRVRSEELEKYGIAANPLYFEKI